MKNKIEQLEEKLVWMDTYEPANPSEIQEMFYLVLGIIKELSQLGENGE